MLLTGAIEKAGSAEPAKIREALENTTGLQGLTCKITFDPKHTWYTVKFQSARLKTEDSKL